MASGYDDDVGDIGGALDLRDLDITSEEVTLEGLAEEIEACKDHDVVKDILEQGSNIRHYAKDVDSKLRQVELESIQDYITESDNLVVLHEQITGCDDILASMEEMLGGFQDKLGSIGSEIKSLQEQSQAMSVKLKNRQQAEAQLATFIGDVAVSPQLIDAIMEGEVNESFLQHLKGLHAKLDFLNTDPSARGAMAVRDVEQELERLRIMAVSKVRMYLMTKFVAMKKPKTNIQFLQQPLLGMKYLMVFLRQHGKEVMGEVRSKYVDVLGKVLASHMATISANFQRQYQEAAGRADLIGAAEGGAGGGGLFGLGMSQRARQGAFSIGEREAVLQQLEEPGIVSSAQLPHVAEAMQTKFPYEVLFRRLNRLLMDTASAEYLFCCDFFGDERLFKELFAGVIKVVEEALEVFLPDCFDAIALLLMIRINYRHQVIMSRRRIPCLDGYLDKVNLVLWPRFKGVFDAHLNSVTSANERTLFVDDTKVHFVARRYADFAAAMMALNAGYQDQQLDHNLERLRGAVVELLARIGGLFPARRQQIVFAINWADHVVAVLRETAARVNPEGAAHSGDGSAPLGKAGAATVAAFEGAFSLNSGAMVEDLLAQHFGDLVGFVKRAEPAFKAAEAAAGGAEGGGGGPVVAPGYGPTEAAPLLLDFSQRWRGNLEVVHKETTALFPNPLCGMEILKGALTQLMLYYTRLLDLLGRAGPAGKDLARSAVTVPAMMYEIKKYSGGGGGGGGGGGRGGGKGPS